MEIKDKFVIIYDQKFDRDNKIIFSGTRRECEIEIGKRFNKTDLSYVYRIISKSYRDKIQLRWNSLKRAYATMNTYPKLAKILFDKGLTYYFNTNGEVMRNPSSIINHACPNNAASGEQLYSILALNKLCNIAKYLNKEWTPVVDQMGYSIFSDIIDDKYIVKANSNIHSSIVIFKTRKLAKQAIDLLGESELRKALMLNH